MEISVRTLFDTPTLSALAQSVKKSHAITEAPKNLITRDTTKITPDLLPLIDLTQDDIDLIVDQVEGGVSNIQDIYALSPLQDGILFHHTMATKGDPYLITTQLSFDNRDTLYRYIDAVQKVVDRHDVLRTAIVWENLTTPAQVVLRQVELPISELSLDSVDGSISEQIVKLTDSREHRIDLTKAPLIRFVIAQDNNGKWTAVQLLHHIIGDNSTLQVLTEEIQGFMSDQAHTLQEPQPFRNLISHIRSGPNDEVHEQFFARMLAEIDTPALPYGLSNVHQDTLDVTESHLTLPHELNTRLRNHAKKLGVSLASLCHLAWAQVVSRTSGQERVVFGTVLFGRMQGGSGFDRAMGLFINTLPLRIDVEETSVEESVRQIQADLAALLEHEHTSLALAQRCSGVAPGVPLFSTVLNCRNHNGQPETTSDIAGVAIGEAKQRTNYPISMSVDDFGTDLSLSSQAVHPINALRMCEYMQESLQSLVVALEHTRDIQVRELEVIPAMEREVLLRTWDTIEIAHQDRQFVHRLFESQADDSPDASAVVFEDQEISYRELNARANSLAHHLIDLGVKPDSLVAICVSRSIEVIVGVLAVLKAGGAYVPLDPTFASERLNDILADASPSILLADKSGIEALQSSTLHSVNVVDPNVILKGSTINPVISRLMPHHLAYVIYTSGSTGKPKGVMIEHRGVANLAITRPSVFGVGPSSRVIQFFSFSFDGSVHDIWSALCFGGSLHILPDHVRQDRLQLWNYFEEHAITQALIAPAVLQDCKDLAPLSTRLNIALGGEALPLALLKSLRGLIPNGSILNDYGPTETTVDAISWKCPDEFDGEIAPIGRPNPNKRVYVLDSYRRLVPMGVTGELYIAGAGIARGYLNNPDLTEKAFLPDLFSEGTESRMYKTGDLVRYLPDGNLMFLGRNDHQVKIRGFRIELGEIETRLAEHSLVREAVVVALGEGTSKRLVAYVVAAPMEGLAYTLREHISSKLPDYMIPAAFVRLDVLPLTTNGKLDRRALPEPDADSFVSQGYEAPQGEIESTLAAIWAELLNVDRVGRNDNFFMLGGHSLLAVQMIERLRRIGMEISVRSLFDTRTLSALAQSFKKSHATTDAPENLITQETTRITPELLPLIDLTQDDIDLIVNHVDRGASNVQDIYALSPLQDGILFHHTMAAKGDPYLITRHMSFDSRDSLDRYLHAVQRVIDRHDVLRTAILWENLSKPAQVVLRHVEMSITELSLDVENGPIVEQIIKLTDPQEHSIDLTQAPLIRFVIAKDVDDSWIAVELFHHLISDHSTLEMMAIEVKAFSNGYGHTLLPAKPFRNLIAHIRSGPSLDVHEQFFTKMLNDIDTPALPYGFSDVRHDGLDVTESHLTLPQELNIRLRDHAKKMGVSLASLCHLAWAQVISKTSGQEQVVFATVLFGRLQGGSGSDQAMGLFINTLPLRIDVGGTSVEKSVRQTQAALAALLDHEHASLALAQRCSSVPPGTPLFSSLLNYRHNSEESDGVLGIEGVTMLEAQERTNYPFTISIEDGGSTLGLTALVVNQFDASRICGYMQQTLQSLADALDHSLNSQVRCLEILPAVEREMLIQSWNTINTTYPDHQFIHRLFESQAEGSPDAVAVVHEGQEISYRDLNARSNSLAHHLIELGVKPDSVVAICVSRSIEMIIGILAVLKAGGAYVPLDPTFASERLNDILADASPSVLLADKSGTEALHSSTLHSMNVVDPNVVPEGPTNNPFIPELMPHHLAYVIYTSGSTGKPKGVMVEHAQVPRLFDATADWYNFSKSDTWIMTHTFSFDVSVWEIWGALRYGGRLVIPTYHVTQSPEELYRLVCESRVTVLNMTPSAFKPLIRSQAESNLKDHLRYVILAGEALEPSMLQSWYATRSDDSPYIVNMYGPTEITVYATYRVMKAQECNQSISPIGVRVPDLTTYILDTYGKPVPLGAAGELCIGGAGVTRGYLNRPDLTSEKFPLDPFSKTEGARMYKTGDLVRYLPDRDLIYMGRNDDQIKIRGYRIELGEIETRLAEHSIVKEAVVVALGEGSSKRLIAYVVADPTNELAHTLHSHVSSKLPDYMIPAAFVRLDVLPLTTNGKLNRRALPEPNIDSFVSQEYEAPQNEIESALANIWMELLKVERVGRNDNFFMLGGHSLLAVQMIERLRRIKMEISVRTLFDTPTLSALAQSLNKCNATTDAPRNMITNDTTKITPELLPLIDLTQSDIDLIVDQVDGGISNIQDIYALSPLQDGILFHHTMATKGDPYVITTQLSFDSKDTLDRYLNAVQQVVNRHDILRTAIMWENLTVPAQVVLRQVIVSTTELSLDSANRSIAEQMVKLTDPREHRIDLTKAPLTRFLIAQDNDDKWIVVQLFHHIIGDNSTMQAMMIEIQAFMTGQAHTLLEPQPFRNLISHIKSGPSVEVHEQFFTKMLAEIDTPALPYGLSNINHDGLDITESHLILPQDLNDKLRSLSRKIGVSLASLCHLAWAQVVSKTSGQEQVVFGTVLLGRMQGGSGSDRAMGLFINTLPLRIDVGSISVESCIRQTQNDLAALLEHEHASLALAQRCSSVAPGTPLFNSLLNYRHNEIQSTEATGIDGIQTLEGQDSTTYPFEFSIDDGGDTLGFTAQVIKPYNPTSICEYMQQALESLAHALENEPNMLIRDLEILPLHERQQLLEEWNDTKHEYPEDQCVHQIFELRAQMVPDSSAIIFEDQMLTYAELNESANRLAHQLIEMGVRPDMRVALCVDRSLAMIVGLLAILKAGGAYVPLDPAYPSDRLVYMLADAAPIILLADNRGKISLKDADLASLATLDPNNSLPSPPLSPPSMTPNPHVQGLTSRHLAYIIYTSGSTGKPKGVMCEHQGLVNLVSARPSVLGVGSESRVLQFSSLSFDASIDWVFSTLCFGGSLYIIPDNIRLDRGQMWKFLERNAITHAELTPALLLDSKDLTPLSTPLALVMGGEALPPTLLQTLKALVPQGSIVNSYGPTETAIEALMWKCPEDFRGDIVPIGRPVANKRLYVLDVHRQPVPLGAMGELYIGGVGIARGYLNRPDVTANVFLPDPFASDDQSIMYKTGDLVRYLPDGNIVYLGRTDYQVKIRGFRIELEEIEARLCDHLIVDEAVVLAMGEGNNKRLVAYLVTECLEGLAHTLHAHLSTKLPEYMVPAAYVRLDVLPLTPNGKLDRRALPEPDSEAFVSQGYEAPQGEIESTLATIWAELLSIERVGRNDNFFMLGGHSLLAVQMIERLRRIGMEISVRTLFDTPTLSALAQSLNKSQGATEAPKNLITYDTAKITPDLLPLIDLTQGDIDLIVDRVEGGVSNVQDIYALSPLQDGILFHHTMAAKGDPYLISSQLLFDSKDVLDRYIDAVQKVVNRHDILRTAIMWENLTTPAQVVLRHAVMSITELALYPTNGPIVEQMAKLTNPREYRIDLMKAPLIRFMISKGDDDKWIAVQLFHHIIGDNSTMQVMMDEIQGFMSDQAHTLPEPQPFRNLISHIRSGPSVEVHEQFFTKMLANIDTPALPYGMANVHQDSLDFVESHLMLPHELNIRLRGQAKKMGVSLASLCHLAWAQVVSKTSGQERVVFGTVLFGRMQGGSGSDQVMGLFINTLPLRVDVEGTSVEASVRQTQADLAALLDHEHASLALAQRCSGVAPGVPLFSTLLNYRNHNGQSDTASDIAGITVTEGQQGTNYPISMGVDDFGTGLSLTSQAVHSVDALRVCEYMQESLQSLVDAMEFTPNMPVREIEILPVVERETLLQTWNSTIAPYPQNFFVHQLFETKVEESPNAIAVVHEDQEMSYSELNSRANSLAHHLIDLGVKPDSLVGICVARSPLMLVAMLAVLKAGGAYVPLDPSYASDRLNHILVDASPSVLVSDGSAIDSIDSTILQSMRVVNPNVVLKEPTNNPVIPGLKPNHLAYVIYTSGSTGKPKGVMIEHYGVMNLAMSRPFVWGAGPSSRVLQFISFSFDGSVHEIWSALCFGGSLYVIDDRVRLDQALLWEYLEEHSITQATLTPTVLQNHKNLPPLSTPLNLMLAGEAVSPRVITALKVLIPNGSIINEYGPTETTVAAMGWKCTDDFNGEFAPIGKPYINKRVYVLDSYRRPTPIGAIGELYIGGDGVARGYFNKLELTEKVFLPDPFAADNGSRMYKTGDLVRYLPDGNIVFMGRNDHQIKIRGFRIELGEIETRLAEHPIVKEAAVIALGEGNSKRLVAYVVAEPTEGLARTLRSHVSSKLPEYMIPAAFVRLDVLPLTPNGKLDRRALPEPDIDSFVSQEYEAPQNEVESTLANVWIELLKVERVGRNDNFFMLGGHSLLAVQMIERLRRNGMEISVRTLFKTPTLSALAQSLSKNEVTTEAPKNLITCDATKITPDLLPLIDLTQDDIDLIVNQVEGGVSNIQDIYTLSPLQDGILFHHTMATKGDPYLISSQFSFDNKDILDQYIDAVQKVINRHDIFRTAIMWENLTKPAQVVLRQVALPIAELSLDSENGPIAEQMMQITDPREYRIDLTKAPLIRLMVAKDKNDKWILVLLFHHIIGDGSTMQRMMNEVQAFMSGQAHTLQEPQPFRSLISHIRLESSVEAHEQFFTKMLAEIDTPALPYELSNVHQDSLDFIESHLTLPQELNIRLRGHAKRMGVSLASLCHLAWAQVVSKTSGQEQVVFGTVLFGRMQGGSGSDRAMGLFLNTLPLRIDIGGTSVEESVRQTQADMAALFEHEHAPLALAQRCSGIEPGAPLFSTVLNCRNLIGQSDEDSNFEGITLLREQQGTNYPISMSIDDYGTDLSLTCQVVSSIDAFRICGYMQHTFQSLVDALDSTPNMQVRELESLPETEREMLIQSWNDTDA
ncbi:hypothetical protein BGX20_010618, partial [Mortierella sp. AD010]